MPEHGIHPVIGVGEPQSLSLATDATADELWVRWQYLGELVEQAGAHMNQTAQRWKDTTDPAVKDRIWSEYESDAREYRVLASWKDLFYAAYIFSTDGAYCAALDDSSPLS